MTPLPQLLAQVAAQTPEPSPTETEFTIYNVTPGISGFIVFFILAVVGWLLFRSMAKHMRRVDQTRRDEERTAAPEEAAGGPAAPDAGAGPAVRSDAAPEQVPDADPGAARDDEGRGPTPS